MALNKLTFIRSSIPDSSFFWHLYTQCFVQQYKSLWRGEVTPANLCCFICHAMTWMYSRRRKANNSCSSLILVDFFKLTLLCLSCPWVSTGADCLRMSHSFQKRPQLLYLCCVSQLPKSKEDLQVDKVISLTEGGVFCSGLSWGNLEAVKLGKDKHDS